MMSASEPAAAAEAPAPVAPPAQPQRAPLDSTWPWGLVCLASLIEFAAAADAENTNSPCDAVGKERALLSAQPQDAASEPILPCCRQRIRWV